MKFGLHVVLKVLGQVLRIPEVSRGLRWLAPRVLVLLFGFGVIRFTVLSVYARSAAALLLAYAALKFSRQGDAALRHAAKSGGSRRSVDRSNS